MPPLYKYLSVKGAKLTLGNRKFKHAKPSDFNDTEDLTIQNIFPEETEAALTSISRQLIDTILDHLNDVPTCSSPRKEQIVCLQNLFLSNPDVAPLIKVEMANERVEQIYDVEHMRARVGAYVSEINEFMQDFRILCVTTLLDSEKMWTNYAENHKGIALRIEPNLAKDSKFKLFRPVTYREKQPPFYANTRDFIADSLFGDQEALAKVMVEKIIYTKTLEWEHESEYRLAIPLRQGEAPWDTLSYQPEEITELYLGRSMERADAGVIMEMAREVNPNIMISAAKRDATGRIQFDRV